MESLRVDFRRASQRRFSLVREQASAKLQFSRGRAETELESATVTAVAEKPRAPGSPSALVAAITRGPEPWEAGQKDTVIAYPDEIARSAGRQA